MMDGIFAGGDYVPNCNKVPLYVYSLSRMVWYYPDEGYWLYKNSDKPDIGIMQHAAPVILAFWSEDD